MFSVGPLQGSNCKQGDLQEANSGFSFQSTHSYHLRGEDNQSQQPNGSNTSDSKWLSLPALVLWMIKDKLDIFDDMCLSVVCRDWLSASKFYPQKLSVGDGLPWIMQKTANKTEREFISITRKTKFTIDLPEFSDAVMLSSINGWFLMKQVHFSWSNGRVVFLINPFTKAKINLPSIDSFNPSLGSFSTYEGHPRCIVLLRRCNNKLTIRTACSGDDLWNECYHIEEMRLNRPYLHSLIIDENVYCFDKSGKMLVCNMTTLICLEVPSSDNVTTSIMEFEGDLVKVDYTNELSFFRYNDAETSWQKLDSDVLKDMSWFLRRDWFESL